MIDLPRPGERALHWVTTLVLGVVALVPVVGNELRVQDVDPMFMRNIIERTAVFGGTYYENGLYNKGMLEPVTYDLARLLTSYEGFWFAISAMVAAAAALLGYVAARTAMFAGANRSVALAIAAVLFVHFTMAETGYSRVLYSRNLTVTALALVWLLALSEGFWTSRRRSTFTAAGIGLLLGAGTQSLLTTAFPGAAVGLAALAILYDRRGAAELRRLGLIGIGAAVAAFLAPPIWYLLRGAFAEYWASWWTYARFTSVGTGRSLAGQFALGGDQFVAHYLQRPLSVLLVVGFFAASWALWRGLDRRTRIVHLGLIGWWFGAWIELVLSQRYSFHYFAVLTVPTALMAAVLTGHATRGFSRLRPRSRASLFLPLVATMVAILLIAPGTFMQQVEWTSSFTSVSAWAEERRNAQGGPTRTAHAVLDLVSERNDALLAWTIDPTVYLKFQRVPASRFQWRSFLVGDIYLGLTSEEYVLADTWEWFEEDIDESQPIAFAETEAFESGTPFEEIIHRDFRLVFPGQEARIWLREDVSAKVLGGDATRPWADTGGRSDDTGWMVTGTTARYEGEGPDGGDDPLTLSGDSCIRLEGTLAAAEGAPPPSMVLRFDDNRGPSERLLIQLEQGFAGSGSVGLGPSGYERVPTDLAEGPIPFELVVGSRAAVLVVNDQVRAALRLPTDSFTVSAQPGSETLELRDLRVGEAPWAC